MAQEQQTRRILIKVDTQGDRGIKNISNELSSMNKSLKRSNDVLSGFQNIFNSVLGASFLGVSAGAIVGVADSMQKLNDRLVTVTGSSTAAGIAFENIRKVAKATNQGVEDVVTVYSRLNLALGDLGLSSNAVLGLTQTLINTFRLSGSTTAEATAATIQLSQGLASGTLRGQELRSVLEQNVIVGDLLTKALGPNGTRGQLMKMAEEGKFTSEFVLKALAGSAYELDERAKALNKTIGEQLTTSFDDLKVSFYEFNKEIGGTEKAISAIKFLADNMAVLAAGIGAVVAYSALGALISGLIALEAILAKLAAFIVVRVLPALGGLLTAINPVTAIIVTLVALIGQLLVSSGALSGVFRTMGESINGDLFPALQKFLFYLSEIGHESNKNAERIPVNMEAIGKAAKKLNDSVFSKPIGGNLLSGFELDSKSVSPMKALIDEIPKMKKAVVPVVSLSEQLKKLNESFNEGKIPVEKYNRELLRLTKLINEGKGPKKLFDETSKVLRDNLSREFEAGKMKVSEYDARLKALNFDLLQQGFSKGYVSLSQFNKELAAMNDKFRGNSALYTGTEAFLQKIGTTTQNVASAIEGTFTRLEDSLLNFIETGKFRFKDFASAVIQDINRIILRAMIIRPLAQGILSYAGASTGTEATDSYGHYAGSNAKGGAFNRGVSFFAKGGVVDRTTAFGMSNGRYGIMGEAGPEAIIPLKRGADGSLGVQASPSNVVVNIVNQAGTEVEQTESTQPDGTRVIDVLITSRVKEGMARGDYDRTLAQAFGITRKGR